MFTGRVHRYFYFFFGGGQSKYGINRTPTYNGSQENKNTQNRRQSDEINTAENNDKRRRSANQLIGFTQIAEHGSILFGQLHIRRCLEAKGYKN